MRKIVKCLALFLAASIFFTVWPQKNIFVWGKGGYVSVFSSNNVDSVSYSAGSRIFDISTSTPVAVTTSSFQAIVKVSLNNKVKSLSVTPEVGVCVSNVNRKPTYEDGHINLGSDMTEYKVNVNNIDPGSTYYYRAYVKLLGEVYYDNVNSVTTLGATPQYTIINGHKFVNLGLPSGLLWAANNIGAATPYAEGDYYAWGETETKAEYSWNTYIVNKKHTKYRSKHGKTVLDPSDDVATVKWGKRCRMPSRSEFQELCSKCSWEWQSDYHGASGYLVIGPNGRSIFFPASGTRGGRILGNHGTHGDYWSNTRCNDSGDNAYYLGSFSSYFSPNYNSSRFYGLCVRPVAEK